MPTKKKRKRNKENKVKPIGKLNNTWDYVPAKN